MGLDRADSVQQAAIVYDGSCVFCVRGAARLRRLGAPGALRLVSSRDAVALESVPSFDPERLERAIQLVSPDGRVYSGAEAVARALATRPAWRLLTWVYWVPGLRAVFDLLYRLVAANRHRIAGRTGEACESGVCAVPGSAARAVEEPASVGADTKSAR